MSCHNGPKLVFTKAGLSVYGASESEAQANVWEFDLVISMTRISTGINVDKCKLQSASFKRLVQKAPEVLSLDWPDMGVPSLGKAFWVELARILTKKGLDRARSGNSYKVMVHCMGGHGRTGTALAILMGLLTDREGDLVDIIQTEYCNHSVETERQIRYVELVTDTKSKAKPSKSYAMPILTDEVYNSVWKGKKDKNYKDMIEDSDYPQPKVGRGSTKYESYKAKDDSWRDKS